MQNYINHAHKSISMNQLDDYFYTVKSEKSKQTYEEYFRYFQEFSKMTVVDLLKLSQKKAQDKLINYVKYMRNKKLAYSSINGRMAPIISFLELNDVLVNKRKIKRYYGEQRKTVKDEAYTTEDIQTMLSQATLREKTMILIYSSSGIRRDAIVDLRLNHLEKIQEYGLYKITVYENSKEEYTGFLTPEASNMVDRYLKFREQSGEKLTKDSPLIRNQFNSNRMDKASNPEPIDSRNLNYVMRQVLLKTGLREANQPVYDRHEKMIFHAFRKFFTNKLIESGVNTEHRFLLEGHALKGQDSAYVRISEKQLLEQYVRALNNLTISDEERLKIKVEKLEIENSRIDDLQAQIDRILKQQRK